MPIYQALFRPFLHGVIDCDFLQLLKAFSIAIISSTQWTIGKN